jgi:hypothetical protein
MRDLRGDHGLFVSGLFVSGLFVRWLFATGRPDWEAGPALRRAAGMPSRQREQSQWQRT